ncbi:MAG: ABC transporter permease [Gemmatimonadales bacterium]
MLLQDLRYAVRSLRRSPGFALAAIVTLGLGIGATTAIFSVVDTVVLRSLPFDQSAALVSVQARQLDQGRADAVSAPDFLDLREEAGTFDGLAAWRLWGMNLTGTGEPENLLVVRATPDLFSILRAHPGLGRLFTPAEETGKSRVAVLSHGFWLRRFGGDSGIIGRSLVLDDEPYEVIGVLPPAFRFPAERGVTLYLPLGFSEQERTARQQRMFNVLGRLAPVATVEAARSEAEIVAARLSDAYPETNRGWSFALRPAEADLIGDQSHLLLLLAAVGCLLLIACTNVAGLLLARGSGRRREMAVRAALGAGRADLLRHSMMESGVLALAGGALGLVLGYLGVTLLLALYPDVLPAWNTPALNLRLLAAALALTALAALLAGLAPARDAMKWDLNQSLRDGATGPRHTRMRSSLVMAEVALAFVLVASAGLLIHSLHRLSRVDPGFEPDRMVVTTLSLPERRYPEDHRQRAFFQEVLARVRSMPGVRDAAMATTLPMDPIGIDHDMAIVVLDQAPADESRQADFRMVSDGFFQAMGIPILQGRDLAAGDNENAPRVAVVNRAFVRQYLDGKAPIGQRIQIGGPSWVARIVGVAGDVRHRGLDAPIRPEVFVAFPQWYSYANMTLTVRSAGGDPGGLIPGIKRAVHAIDPDQPLSGITTMSDLIAASTGERRFNLLVFGSFAAIGLVLAVTGIYGVVSFIVGQQKREFGIRLALGATRQEILATVLRRALRLAGVGITLGLAGAITAGTVLRRMLYGVDVADPWVLTLAIVVLGGGAVLAALVPARRAAGVDPVVALKSE